MLSEKFVKVADIKDIKPSEMKQVRVDGEDICLANVDGKFYAIGNICTHEGGPLADGTLMHTKLNAHGMALNLMSEQAK